VDKLVTEDEDGQKWVAVRISVAVNSIGEWVAYGVWDYDKSEGFEVIQTKAKEVHIGPHDVHYVYARVPVHEHRVFAGVIE